jgi:hypothetical protein
MFGTHRPAERRFRRRWLPGMGCAWRSTASPTSQTGCRVARRISLIPSPGIVRFPEARGAVCMAATPPTRTTREPGYVPEAAARTRLVAGAERPTVPRRDDNTRRPLSTWAVHTALISLDRYAPANAPSSAASATTPLPDVFERHGVPAGGSGASRRLGRRSCCSPVRVVADEQSTAANVVTCGPPRPRQALAPVNTGSQVRDGGNATDTRPRHHRARRCPVRPIGRDQRRGHLGKFVALAPAALLVLPRTRLASAVAWYVGSRRSSRCAQPRAARANR